MHYILETSVREKTIFREEPSAHCHAILKTSATRSIANHLSLTRLDTAFAVCSSCWIIYDFLWRNFKKKIFLAWQARKYATLG